MRGISRYILQFAIIVSVLFVWQWNRISVLGENCNIDLNIHERNFFFSPDDKMVVLSLDEGDIMVWNVATGKLVKSFSFDTKSSITSVDVSPDNKYLLAGYASGEVVLWDVDSRTQSKPFLHSTDYELTVKFSPNGKYFLTYTPSTFPNIILWKSITGEKALTLPKEADPRDHRGFTFSPSGDYLLVHYWNETGSNVELWEIATGVRLKTFTPAFSAVITPDNSVAIVNQAKALMFWDISKQIEVDTILLDFPGFDIQPEISSKGDYLLFADLWNIKEKKTVLVLESPAKFSEDGKFLITYEVPRNEDPLAIHQITVTTLDVGTRQEVQTISVNISGKSSFINWAISANADFIATLDSSGSVKLWDGQTGRQLRVLTC